MQCSGVTCCLGFADATVGCWNEGGAPSLLPSLNRRIAAPPGSWALNLQTLCVHNATRQDAVCVGSNVFALRGIVTQPYNASADGVDSPTAFRIPHARRLIPGTSTMCVELLLNASAPTTAPLSRVTCVGSLSAMPDALFPAATFADAMRTPTGTPQAASARSCASASLHMPWLVRSPPVQTR
ncbi:hypothetical protein EON67_10460 [archaeon]|nr:MAG: hypothetical protein EON67_10460 [archaeon]